ncbi:MAG TPA: TlpA disulfide reductase family protein [Steroidobacteraceae bacterium]|nr:TlpA disulfide reductase family protein [Steroidobacteraceae bacterium]
MRVRKWAFITLAAVAALQEIRSVSATEVCSASARQANLDFTLHDVDGREIALSHFRGDVVLLNFWATWCAPCRVEIPDFIVLYEKYHERGLVILGVSVDDPVPRLVSFVAEFRMTYPVLVGAERRDFLDAFGQLAGFPTSLLISREGKVCARYEGLADKTELEGRIRALLQPDRSGSLGPGQ